MNPVLVILILMNYAYVGLLPRIFFKKDGRYNLMWWMTAGPLFLNALIIFAHFSGLVQMTPYWSLSLWDEGLVVLMTAFSVGMISYTMGTHRIPLALWHQNNDAPANIVTWGAYKYVRHPFYTSFITTQIASIILLPHWSTIAGLFWCITILHRTAQREEDNLSNSNFGAEYQAYMKTTGRFLPKFGEK